MDFWHIWKENGLYNVYANELCNKHANEYIIAFARNSFDRSVRVIGYSYAKLLLLQILVSDI